MDTLDAIRGRRTTKSFRPESAARPLIERVLEGAVWAPNHRLTEPWHFTVVQGHTLKRLAQLRRQMTEDDLRAKGEPAERIAREGDSAERKALAAPVTVAVSIDQHPDPVVREEDFAAAACAIQNILLAAHALGLAGFWSTNRLCAYPPAYDLLGIPPARRIVGLVQLGYPEQQREQRRTPAAERTVWLD